MFLTDFSKYLTMLDNIKFGHMSLQKDSNDMQYIYKV